MPQCLTSIPPCNINGLLKHLRNLGTPQTVPHFIRSFCFDSFILFDVGIYLKFPGFETQLHSIVRKIGTVNPIGCLKLSRAI